MRLEFAGHPVRRCGEQCCAELDFGHHDFTCIYCGVTVPTCEGGGELDEVVSSWHGSEVGVCAPCGVRLEKQ